MPAFTFEKISSPVPKAAKPVTIKGNSKHASVKRSRSLIAAMMDRFAVARMGRDKTNENFIPPHKRPPPD